MTFPLSKHPVRNHSLGKQLLVTLVLLLTLILAACGGGGGGAAAPAASTPAPAATEPAAPEAPAAEAPTVEAPTAPAAEAAEETAAEEETAEEATTEPAAESAGEGTGETIVFTIDPSRSSVRFILDELLRNQPTTVVGEGNGIAGTVTVNLGDYSQTTISPIQIDARSLATDNDFRNQAIGRFILQSNDNANQYILFTPTAVDGLPESATVGHPFDLTVTGDLQIRTITQPVTFNVTVTPVSETEIQGSGSTSVNRADFELQIPSVPHVADVSEAVQLEIDFVAVAQ